MRDGNRRRRGGEGNKVGRSLGMSLASAIWGTLESEMTVGLEEKRPAGCGPGPAQVGSLGWRKRFRGVREKKREREKPRQRGSTQTIEDRVNQEGSGQPGRRLRGSRGWETGRKGLRSQLLGTGQGAHMPGSHQRGPDTE